MAASNSIIEFLKDALAPLGAVSVRRMFGGAMVYIDGAAVGLLDDDIVYFKADDTTKVMFEVEGLGPFVYEGQTRPVTMSYWRIPERLYDEPDEMVDWARAALGVARAVAAKKTKLKSAQKLGVKKTPASKKPTSKSSRRKS
jgi:DNA transformation protein and related proteins